MVLYNKGEQLKSLGYSEDVLSEAKNILRFEMQIKSKSIKELLDYGNNEDILNELLVHSKELVQKAFVKMFGGGCFLSPYWMNKVAKRRFTVNKCDKMKEYHKGKTAVSEKVRKNLEDKFLEIWVNPVKSSIPFVPSIHRIFDYCDEATLEREIRLEEYISAKSRWVRCSEK